MRATNDETKESERMYLTTTTESISSAVNYGSSLKAPVSFACLVCGADRIRQDIKEGRVAGVRFPPDPKPKRKSFRAETEEERRRKVEQVHEFRRQGLKAREAAKEAGLCYQTYSRWRDDSGIEYDGECLRGKWRTNYAQSY